MRGTSTDIRSGFQASSSLAGRSLALDTGPVIAVELPVASLPLLLAPVPALLWLLSLLLWAAFALRSLLLLLTLGRVLTWLVLLLASLLGRLWVLGRRTALLLRRRRRAFGILLLGPRSTWRGRALHSLLLKVLSHDGLARLVAVVPADKRRLAVHWRIARP